MIALRKPAKWMCYEPVNGKPNHCEYQIIELDFQDAVAIKLEQQAKY